MHFRLGRLAGATFGAFALLLAAPALADHLVVKRHVTFHEGPAKATAAIAYPTPGDQFQLLDDGARVAGYYHVARSDGRVGWIYFTFVERRAGDIAVVEPPVEPATSASMAVHYIDVDQGAAALLEFPCGAVMIDAGGRGPAAKQHLLDYLHTFFTRRTDLHNRIATIFLTHTHIDHDSNLKAVTQAFDVRGFVDNGIDHGSGRAAYKWMHEHAALPGSTIALEDILEPAVLAADGEGLSDAVIDPVACQGVDPQIRVLSGGDETNPGWASGEFGNNRSLVIRVDFGEASFLFTGDMEDTAIPALIEHWQGTAMLDADVWEVGHHGSANGTTPALLAAITPELAVISMGHQLPHAVWTAWAYGHPRRVALDRLVAGVSGIRAPVTVWVADAVKSFSNYPLTRAVYATGWEGDVTVRADAAGHLSVATGQ
jgi:beta-lactamase superfamily II metal-dependent hydrolase